MLTRNYQFFALLYLSGVQQQLCSLDSRFSLIQPDHRTVPTDDQVHM